jgi:hypothetical protein
VAAHPCGAIATPVLRCLGNLAAADADATRLVATAGGVAGLAALLQQAGQRRGLAKEVRRARARASARLSCRGARARAGCLSDLI